VQMVMKGKVYVIVADGFEEMDVSAVTCTLRGLGLPVAVVGLTAGPVRGAYGLSLVPDCTLGEVVMDSPRAAVLPGGILAARRFSAEPRVHALLRQVVDHNGYLMAIDTARTVLYSAGVSATGEVGGQPSGRVLVKGHVIVSEDSGAAEEAALTLASML
jgi:putative intracellular protease/amidase